MSVCSLHWYKLKDSPDENGNFKYLGATLDPSLGCKNNIENLATANFGHIQ